MMFTKPCRRPICPNIITKAMRSRFNATVYCSITCAAQHRVELGGHPFHRRTPEQRHRNAAIGGKTRAEHAKQRKLREVAGKIRKHLPPEWDVRLGAREVARIIALGVRAYLDGHEDGYQGGYTAAYREKQKGQVA